MIIVNRYRKKGYALPDKRTQRTKEKAERPIVTKQQKMQAPSGLQRGAPSCGRWALANPDLGCLTPAAPPLEEEKRRAKSPAGARATSEDDLEFLDRLA